MLNRYYGWYVSPGDLATVEVALEAEISAWVSAYDKPIIFAEYGADTFPGLHDVVPYPWCEEYQADLLAMFHRVLDPLRRRRRGARLELRRLRHRPRCDARRRQQNGRLHPRAATQGSRLPAATALARGLMTGTSHGTTKLRSSQYLGYAAGDVANNLTFQMVAVSC
jgi:hypothetical protein